MIEVFHLVPALLIGALAVYTTVARYSTHAGTPLRAVIACKVLIHLDPKLAERGRWLVDRKSVV